MSPPEFTVPSKLEELVGNDLPFAVEEVDLDEAVQAFDGVVDALCDRSTNIVEQDNLNVLVALVRSHPDLSDAVKSRLLDVLVSGLACLPIHVDSVCSANADGPEKAHELATARNAIRMHVMLLKSMATQCEKQSSEVGQEPKVVSRAPKGAKGAKGTMGGGKKTGKVAETFGWETQRPKLMQTFKNVLSAGLERAWSPSRPEESLVAQILAVAWLGLGSAAAVKDKDTRSSCMQMVLSCVGPAIGQSTNAVTGLQDLLHQHEHAAAPIAELVAAAHAAGESAFVAEMMNEVGRVPFHELARDTAAAKNLAAFVAELSEAAPAAILSHMSVLNPHLQQGEAYTMRNAVLHAIGQALVELARISRNERSDAVVKARESLLAIMRERVHDVNAFTRSKVLQVWATLCERDAIPKKAQPAVVLLATERLQDKSAQVRKSAIQLLRALVQKNPYAPTLPLSVFRAKLAEAEEKLSVKEEAMARLGQLEAKEGEEGEAEEGGAVKVKEEEGEDGAKKEEGEEEEEEEGKKEAAAEEEEEGREEARKEAEEDKELEELRSRVNFYAAAVHFVSTLHRAVSMIEALLRSSAVSDVVEATHFLVAAYPFRMEVAEQSVRKMLLLIWSREQPVKDAVADAYRQIFLAPLQEGRKEFAGDALAVTAARLAALCRGANVGEMASLEQVLAQMGSAGQLPPALLGRVWEVMVGGGERSSDAEEESEVEQAAMLLSIAAGNAEGVLVPKLKALLHGGEALGRLLGSPVRARCLSAVLGRLGPALPPQERGAATLALLRVAMAEGGEDGRWLPACEEALNALCKVHPAPHQVQLQGEAYASVLRGMAVQVFGREGGTCEGWRLARLLHAVGHVAVKQLAVVEGVAAAQARERDRAEAAGEGAKGKKEEGKEEEEGIEATVGAVDAAVQDTRAEAARELAERDLLGAGSLVGAFGPLVREVCANAEGQFGDARVRVAGVLAMSKLMCVSAPYCEENLQLLFSIMVAAPEPVIRSNIVVALGDMAFRWTNLTEPWMGHIYSLLRDHATEVRHNALTVLTHLVLNDMIKVRGQVSEMALCLEDADERIQDMARLFLAEFKLKQQGMLLYNLLPDMIGRLSAAQLDEGKFRRVVRFVFGLVDKVKQTDALVDKLCQRFRATDNARQWRDIAFCLGQLTLSEKGVRKLLEEANFKAFANKLGDEDIAASFHSIAAKAKKLGGKAGDKGDGAGGKEGGRSVGEELEARLKEAMGELEVDEEGAEAEGGGGEGEEGEEGAGRRPEAAVAQKKAGDAKGKGKGKAAAAKAAAAKAAPAKGRSRRKVQSSDEEDEEDEDEEVVEEEEASPEEEPEEKENVKANAKRQSRSAPKAAKAAAAPAPARTSGRATRSARGS